MAKTAPGNSLGMQFQCLKTPGGALPLTAELQHDRTAQTGEGRELEQICQHQHSSKLMGSNCSTSLARQVGKPNYSSCRRWVGRGEEAEKGEFKIFALEVFFANFSMYEQTTELSAWGEAEGLMPENSAFVPEEAARGAQNRAPHSMILVDPTQNIL